MDREKVYCEIYAQTQITNSNQMWKKANELPSGILKEKDNTILSIRGQFGTNPTVQDDLR
jgi:hypothetical protein